MEKLLFFDIDGTLLPVGSHAVPKDAVQALQKARQNGCGIFINTGRTYAALPPAVLDLQPDGFICGCGTSVYMDGKRLMRHVPSAQVCLRVMRELRRKGIPTVYEADEGVFFDGDSFGNHHPAVQRHFQAVPGTKILHEPLPEDLQFEKLVCYANPHRRRNTIRDITAPEFTIILRENRMAEVTMSGYTKATGIRWMMEHIGIDAQNCFAFGDSTNDIDMLQAVPHSVAMGNSMPEVLALCEHVTTDILQGGIANALKHYQLI